MKELKSKCRELIKSNRSFKLMNQFSEAKVFENGSSIFNLSYLNGFLKTATQLDFELDVIEL